MALLSGCLLIAELSAGGAAEVFSVSRLEVAVLEAGASTSSAAIAEVQKLLGAGVKTYVVGFGSGVDAATLNSMATAGGTAKVGTSKYYTASNAVELSSALATIAAKTCGSGP